MTRPTSGIQLYLQRLAALNASDIYTRLPNDSFALDWLNTNKEPPTYQEWINLLTKEAHAISKLQDDQRLIILLGDSISLWFPPDLLPTQRLWLNQGISGDTIAGILRRLSVFDQTRPNAIYILAGVNDLKNCVSDRTILKNYRECLLKLHHNHPQTQLIVQSILPTDLPSQILTMKIPNSRINQLNQQLRELANQENASYLELHSHFLDQAGKLKPELTTDGLHLNYQGYKIWQWILAQTES